MPPPASTSAVFLRDRLDSVEVREAVTGRISSSAVGRPQLCKFDDGDNCEKLLESHTKVPKPTLAKHESVKVDSLIRDPKRNLRHVRREGKGSRVEGKSRNRLCDDSRPCSLFHGTGFSQSWDSRRSRHTALMLSRRKGLIKDASVGASLRPNRSVTSAVPRTSRSPLSR